jgi:hypothetical protein
MGALTFAFRRSMPIPSIRFSAQRGRRKTKYRANVYRHLWRLRLRTFRRAIRPKIQRRCPQQQLLVRRSHVHRLFQNFYVTAFAA